MFKNPKIINNVYLDKTYRDYVKKNKIREIDSSVFSKHI